jgi:hypothetical protein
VNIDSYIDIDIRQYFKLEMELRGCSPCGVDEGIVTRSIH